VPDSGKKKDASCTATVAFLSCHREKLSLALNLLLLFLKSFLTDTLEKLSGVEIGEYLFTDALELNVQSYMAIPPK
jgi:hypothetical protein